jgi:thymidylate synthase
MPSGGTQLERVVAMLKETPLTNQAVIEVATPEDLDLCYGKDGKIDPPCLRLLDFKAIPSDAKPLLTVSAYFRSWDLWAGFPTNLGGIELLKQFVAAEASLGNGPMYAYSAGAHIYGYQEEIARIRTLRPKGP